MIVKFNKSITVLARLDHDKFGDPHTIEEWTFDEGEELEVSSIDWSEITKLKKGKKQTIDVRFAKLNIESQKGYIWMVPEDYFNVLTTTSPNS